MNTYPFKCLAHVHACKLSHQPKCADSVSRDLIASNCFVVADCLIQMMKSAANSAWLCGQMVYFQMVAFL